LDEGPCPLKWGMRYAGVTECRVSVVVRRVEGGSELLGQRYLQGLRPKRK
jgi:hypothetical protein